MQKKSMDMGKLREEEVEGAMDEDEEIIAGLLQLSQTQQGRVEEIAEKLTPDEVAALTIIQLSQDTSQLKEVKTIEKQVKNRVPIEEDDSQKTLDSLLDWINNTAPKTPPQKIIDIVGVCSKPIRKQLMVADVKKDQMRLMLGKKQVRKMMLDVMEVSEVVSLEKLLKKNGLVVRVYGKDTKKDDPEMMFKMWNTDTPVLTGKGWIKFFEDYGLKEHSDFVSVWMFRHKQTNKICFAIECTRFDGISQRLSTKDLEVGPQ